MSYLTNLLSVTGSASSSRMVLLLTTAVVLAKTISFNIASLAHGGGPIPFDVTDIGLLGIAFTGKVLNSATSEKGV